MRRLLTILGVARRSFRGKLTLRFAVVIAMALLTGTSAGLLPAVIGRAVGAVAGMPAGPKAPGGLSRWLAAAMPADSPWMIVLFTLVATVVTIGIGVFASKLGSAMSGDVTAALRVEMMNTVLAASARDVQEVGAAITAPRRPPGMAPAGAAPPGKLAAQPPPPGKVAAGQTPPPGKLAAQPAPPGRVAAGQVAPRAAAPGATDSLGGKAAGATREAVVRLAVSREAAMVSDFAVSVITGLLQSIATLIVLAAELISSDAWLVLAGGSALFVTSRLLADRASRRVGLARRDMQNADAAVFGTLQETLSATEDLRLWGARRQAVAEFAEVAYGSADARERFAAALAVSGQIKSVFTAMAPLLIVVALKLAGRPYDAGEVAKLLLLVPLLMVRLEALDGIRQGFIEREPIIDATQKLLALPSAPPRASDARSVELSELKGHLAFEHVGYTPPGANRAILSDVSLDIEPGAVVGICGPSGSGKSSLLRLLLRLDDPSEGRITIDGIDVRQIEPEQLPSIFGVVQQTSGLLQRPVEDNLAIGLTPPPSRASMEQAIRAVHMNQLLSGDDDNRNLSTTYRKSPPNFSGGEVRRLLIARMLVGGAPVGVLDEPEAGLPSATAEDILGSLVKQAEGRTVVVVTHAPQLLRSDYNVVLDQGRVVGVGPHAQLVQRCPAYKALLAEALQGDTDDVISR